MSAILRQDITGFADEISDQVSEDEERWASVPKPSVGSRWVGWLVLVLAWSASFWWWDDDQNSTRNCYGGDVNLTIHGAGMANISVLAVGALGGRVPESENATASYKMVGIMPVDGCSNLTRLGQGDEMDALGIQKHISAYAAPVRRGNCSFSDKIQHLRGAGISLMVEYDGINDHCVRMDFHSNRERPREMDGVSVTSHLYYDVIKDRLAGEGKETTVSIVRSSRESISRIDIISEAELAVLVVGILVVSSYWALHVELSLQTHDGRSWIYAEHMSEQDNNQVITLRTAWSFIFFASAALFLMFLLSSKLLSFLFAFLFAVTCWDCMNTVLSQWLSMGMQHMVSSQGSSPPLNLSYYAEMASLILSTVLCSSWLLNRHSSCWWILQDLLAFFLLVMTLTSIKIPNLKVGTILLLSAMVYDVWWVYIQPMVTHSMSVMVSIANGPSLPLFMGIPSKDGFAMIGLGDIIIPGLLIVFSKLWDARNMRIFEAPKGSIGYFWPMILAYVTGLVCTCLALEFDIGSQNGQPALLYLVPCTLGTFVIISLFRGEFKVLWRGGDQFLDEEALESQQSLLEEVDTTV